MKYVFIVTQQGIYRHAIVGAYVNQQDACDAAVVAIKAEKDNYHHFDVRKFELNAPIPHDGVHVFRVKREQDLRELCDYVLLCENEEELKKQSRWCVDCSEWHGLKGEKA